MTWELISKLFDIASNQHSQWNYFISTVFLFSAFFLVSALLMRFLEPIIKAFEKKIENPQKETDVMRDVALGYIKNLIWYGILFYIISKFF